MDLNKMREDFNDFLSKKPAKNNHFQINTEKYNNLLAEIKEAKVSKTTDKAQKTRFNWVLKHYDILEENGKEQLVAPTENGKILYYVPCEDLFDVLHDTHIAVGHGGRNRMRKELQQRYANVTVLEIQSFLNLCQPCLKKRKTEKKGLVNKTLILSQFSSRGLVNIVDFQSHADGDYKFIMIYQDHVTKFIVLRPLKSYRADEIASQLLDLFLIFGAPAILQSENGQEFVQQILVQLKLLWPELKMILGKPPHDLVERLNETIKRLVTSWMWETRSGNWSVGLNFVQFARNQGIHPIINRSPFGGMFGQPARNGLSTPLLTREIIASVHTEEDLEKLFPDEEYYSEDDDEEADDPGIMMDRPPNTHCSLCRIKLEPSEKDICVRCFTSMRMKIAKKAEPPSKRAKH